MEKPDILVMKLLHYFITKKDYVPIILHGVENEIWLENLDEEYKVIRLVLNYIHNDEQYQFDLFKTKSIVKKIKRKTMTFNVNTLSLYFDMSDYVNMETDNHISSIQIKTEKDLYKSKEIVDVFTDIKDKLKFKEKGNQLFEKITSDLNKKNKKENKKMDEIFKEKKPYITQALIVINVLIFLIFNSERVFMFGGLLKNGQIYRIFTSMFLHYNIIHLGLNMYVLYVLGKQIETFYSHYKYLFIYIFSGVIGALVSLLFMDVNTISLGASGAVFGLLGAFLYFSLNFKNMFSNQMTKNILSVLFINLLFGYIVGGIDLFAHIGGFIGGMIAANVVGIKHKTEKMQKINAIVVAIISIALLVYFNYF